MVKLFPVRFEGNINHLTFVAFSAQAASDYIAAEQLKYDSQPHVLEDDWFAAELPFVTEEVALVDHYGFPCKRNETSIVAPWIAEVGQDAFIHYSAAQVQA
jgi:hypothetical protein